MSILDSLERILDTMEVTEIVEDETVSEEDLKKLLIADADKNIINELVEGKKDPKAEVRNKPDPIFDDKNPKVTDAKDHFPINTIGKARNALARANQFSSAPKWYKGSLEQLKKAVAKAVHKAYPEIKITKKATD